ncbi:MAG: hypothetical protein AAF441_08860 [Pseudomonadota bacterium]
MKRQKAKRKTRSKQSRPQSGPQTDAATKAPPTKSRRQFLDFAKSWGVVGALAVGGGWYLIDEVTATIAEGDLSKIGNGIPTVVQIHDPSCPRCTELQRQARKAMGDFGSDELQFLVANIKSEKGRALATKHGVGHITLLMLDGGGTRRDALHGVHDSSYLSTVFRSHADRFAKPSS